MKIKNIKSLIFACSLILLFGACRKDVNDADETLESGTTFIGVPEGLEQTLYFSPFTSVKTIDAFSIKRDAASNTDLQKAQTFTLTALPGAVPSGFDALPASLYTIANKSVTTTSTGWKVAFSPGDFVQKFTINLDGSKWTDLSKKYALAFKITDAGGASIHAASNDTILVELAIKNKYDGNYEVAATSPMVDITNSTLTGYYPLDSDLATVSSNSVVMFCNTYLGGYEGHPIKSGTSDSYYGNFAPVFTMDDNGNVISVTNYYGQGTNSSTRAARLDPSGVNKFTVSANGNSKTLEVSYIMVQGNNDRTFFREKWTFKGER